MTKGYNLMSWDPSGFIVSRKRNVSLQNFKCAIPLRLNQLSFQVNQKGRVEFQTCVGAEYPRHPSYSTVRKFHQKNAPEPSVIYITREISPDLIPVIVNETRITNPCPSLNLLFPRNREKRKRLLQYSNTMSEQRRNENGIFCHHANYHWEGKTEDREEG